MRIGIITFWWSQDNYGQLLQCYALQKYLRDFGHDAYTIRYYKPPFRVSLRQKFVKYVLHPWRLMDGVRRVIARKKSVASFNPKVRDFDGFRTKYLTLSEAFYTTAEELCTNSPPADAYIVGSDQVWNVNYDYNKDDMCAFFLDFGGKAVKRIAYAASFGSAKLTDKQTARLQVDLGRFNAISVREPRGKEMCEEAGKIAELVNDPTLLLSKEEYLKLANPGVHRTRPYIFVYMLTNECEFSLRKLSAWAQPHGLDLVYVNGNAGQEAKYDDSGFPVTDCSIPDWLAYLRDADYVVTNSFHCSVFATIFGRKIAVVPLKGLETKANERIERLFSLSGNQLNWLIGNDYSALERAVPLSLPNSIAESGKSFLSKLKDIR